MDQAAVNTFEVTTAVIFNNLDDVQIRPRDVSRPTATMLAGVEALQDGVGVSRKAIHGKQDRASDPVGSLANAAHKPFNQGAISAGRDFTPDEQPGKDSHRRRHPDFAALGVDTQFIGLDLA
jgi:hypothetical protein